MSIRAYALAGLLSLASLTASAAEPVVLKFASFTAAADKSNEALVTFIKAVEEASEGSLKIEFFPGGTLGSNPQVQLKLIEDGVVDIARVVASYTPGRFPELNVVELPFLGKNNTENSVVVSRLYAKGHLSGFDSVHLLGVAISGPYGLHTATPIKSVDQIKGRKLRVGGPVQGQIARQLGGVPVGNIPAPAIGEAVGRGVVDGTLMASGNIYGFALNDVTFGHLVNVPLGSVAVLFPMNRKKYESLPPKAKAALDKFSGEWFTRTFAGHLDAETARVLALLEKDPKHTIVKLPDAEVEKIRTLLADVKAPFDKPNAKGVNIYREYMSILRDVEQGK